MNLFIVCQLCVIAHCIYVNSMNVSEHTQTGVLAEF